MNLRRGLDSPVDDVAAAFAATVRGAFASRTGERFTLVLSGGPTARRCYGKLAETGSEPPAIDWSVVSVYLGDERLVPADHPEANQLLVRESLLDRIGTVAAFRPMPTGGPARECAAAYQRTIAELLQGDGIDLIHLGLGSDGHTASLFPGSAALAAGPGELVVATTDPNGQNPHARLSLTLPAINQARLAVFTVEGEAKRDAVAALRSGEEIPAARVAAGEVRWLIDIAAFGDADPGGPRRDDRPGNDQEAVLR
ncbi:MAG TPA: 6-phosphogluconolactonase [Acidimicrobiales bacterium]|nr:6-phosphogluconolactonase [Acidimicrobiales bacterium]